MKGEKGDGLTPTLFLSAKMTVGAGPARLLRPSLIKKKRLPIPKKQMVLI